MVYTETTSQKVTFDKADILNWAKTFAAKQMGIDVGNLSDESIEITGDDVFITVTYTKQSSSKREEA